MDVLSIFGWSVAGLVALYSLPFVFNGNPDGGVRWMMHVQGWTLLVAAVLVAILPISKFLVLLAIPVSFFLPMVLMGRRAASMQRDLDKMLDEAARTGTPIGEVLRDGMSQNPHLIPGSGRGAFLATLLWMVLIFVLWDVLVHIVPWDIGRVVVNIGFLALSILILGPLGVLLRQWLPGWPSYIVAGLLWFGIFQIERLVVDSIFFSPQKDSAAVTGTGDKGYVDAMAAIIEPVSTATDNWSAVFGRASNIDTSKLSRDQARNLMVEMLDTATKLHTVMANATTVIRDVLPPTECANFHLKVLESLQLAERGSLQAKGYFETLLGQGHADNSALDSTNELLARADRAKVEAELAAKHDGCALVQ